MSEQVAACRELPAMLNAYPPDKRLTITVPAKEIGGAPVGTEVLVVGSKDYSGNPAPNTLRVQGRVKRLVAEVEIDLATLEEPQHEGQGTLT